MKKRIASLVLAVLMVLVSVPVFSLSLSATDTAYTYTTSWQKNMPQFKFVDTNADGTVDAVERVVVSDAWATGTYTLTAPNSFRAYSRFSLEGTSTVHCDILNESVGIFSAPSYAGHPYTMRTMDDANSGFRYVAEYDGTVDISIDSLYFIKNGTQAHHVFAVFKNGTMIWPTANGSYTDDTDWWSTETTEADVSNEIAAHANAAALRNITLTAGDTVDFIFSWDDANGTATVYADQYCHYDFDASVKYHDPTFRIDSGLTEWVIPGTPTVYGSDITSNIFSNGVRTLVSSADYPTHMTETAFLADADAVATYGTYSAYLLAFGEYEWTGDWAGGGTMIAHGAGSFAENTRRMFLDGKQQSTITGWATQGWFVTEALFASAVEKYVAKTGTTGWGAASGAGNNTAIAICPTGKYSGVSIHQYTSPAAATASFSFNKFDWNWVYGDRICIVIDGVVVFPENASWDDPAGTWYSLDADLDFSAFPTDNTQKTAARATAMANLNAALQGKTYAVEEGSKIQFCVTRDAYSKSTEAGTKHTDSPTNARRFGPVVSLTDVIVTPGIPTETYYYNPATDVVTARLDSATYTNVTTGGYLSGTPTFYLNLAAYQAANGADKTAEDFKAYLMSYGKFAWGGGWVGGYTKTTFACGTAVIPIERNFYLSDLRPASTAHTAWYNFGWHVSENAFEIAVDRYVSGNNSGSAWGNEGAATASRLTACPSSGDGVAVYAHEYVAPVTGLATFHNYRMEHNWQAGDRICIVVGDAVVWPENAIWSDSTTWYDAGANATDTDKGLAAMNAALADLRVDVSVGDRVQFCLTRTAGSSTRLWDPEVKITQVVEATGLRIEDTSVSIAERLAMNYYVRMQEVPAGAQVGVEIDGVFYAGALQADGTYKANAPGMPAKDIARAVTAYSAVKVGNTVLRGEPHTTSIALRLAQYTTNSYSDNYNALARAALNYAAAAQTYFEVADEAANIYLTPEARATAVRGTYTDRLTYTNGTTVSAAGMDLALMDNISFLLNITADKSASYTAVISDGIDSYTATADDFTETETGYRIVFSDIAPTSWNTLYTVTVTNDADATDALTLTYSVSTYAVRTAGNADVKAVTDTMMALYEAIVAHFEVALEDTTAPDYL